MTADKALVRALLAGTALSLSAVEANAQTVCNRQVGPDVIVGALHRDSNNTAAGSAASTSWAATVNGVPMCAFSVGTTSCNVGNFNLNWIQGNNQHPVIGQNIFRLKTIPAGTGSYQTFEHLGYSWLKHGFCALTQFECCATCTNPGGCNSVLVPSCSDPYTASRNSGQSALGPKWQVNANTGVFTYPPANPTYTNNTISRRNQIPASELDLVSSFFVEGQYVAQDDASSGNQDNNASYRPIHFTGGPTVYTMWLDSITQREKSAIQAWKIADPAVTESIFAIPNEGKLIVSSKATDIGNGMWHYEYAVYNMNSDQAIGSFSVPLPAGATVENIGFHDVSYHDGDGPGNANIDGTNWPSARASNTISWSTTPFATSASANAIRWATLYNFRFDANVAPAPSGSATLGLWKSPAVTYDLAAQVPGEGGGPCYANCDSSTTAPILNVQDFTCFLQRYAAGESYANCDQSTEVPVLNVQDFTCFLQSYAAGCP
jgi:hypothetical protein